MSRESFDVVAVSLKGEPRKVRVFARDEDEENAEAVIKMAVMRRGVEEEFYTTTRPGAYNDGDIWKGSNP